MLAKRDGTAVVDLAVMVASPALIMLMVGSLVWFLVEVLAPSPHPGRLMWCLSFFVFGAVLIARLTIEQGSSAAAIYAVGLGGATFLAMIRFVEYPNAVAEAAGWAVSFALMGLVWWLANRLTWDCTHLDEDQRTSGRGLLAAAGLDAPAGDEAEAEDEPARPGKPRKKDSPGLMGWVERFGRHREARRKRPHTPGTWVLYVGLAALPVLALGQSLVPADDLDRRRATLLDAMAFVSSGLGLLVVTSLMGLRRYLEQRDARVPLPMTAGWLGLGAGLIAVFVVAAALLPRPHSETAWFGMIGANQPGGERSASRNAALRDNEGGKGDGVKGTKSDADGKESGEGKEPGTEGGDGQDGGRSGGDGRKGAGGSGRGKSGQGGKSGEPSRGGRQSGGSQVGKALDAAGSVVKWVVWAVVALLVIATAVFFVLKGLSPFTAWAGRLLDWLRNLFRRREAGGAGDPEAEATAGPERPPFAEFSNPFTDGTAPRRPAADLALYTLAALDSWAWDHGAGRLAGETPAEFAARLGADFPDLDAAGRRAADLAVRALYSNAPLPADAPKALAALWQRMDAAAPAVAR